MLGRLDSPVDVELSGIYLGQTKTIRRQCFTVFIYSIIHVIKCKCFFFNRPVLGGGDEEGRQLAQDDDAGVDEDAAEHRQSQQAGWGSAVVQLLAGASSPHHNGQ